jgi:hypothetical protein
LAGAVHLGLRPAEPLDPGKLWRRSERSDDGAGGGEKLDGQERERLSPTEGDGGIMGGNYGKHVDDFGFCTCQNRSGIEPMNLESQDEWGRWSYSKYPACADCFGLI